MSNKTAKTVQSFVNQFAAIIKGDTAEATAEKAWRQAKSGLQTEIAKLEGNTISLEDKVTTAQENFTSAKVNSGQLITDREGYVAGILRAKAELNSCEKTLKNHLENLNLLKDTLVELETA
jgi:uncharacterized protein (DUF342 family)